MIYVVQEGRVGFVKVGYADDVRRRVRELQVGCPRELRLVATLEGDAAAEAELHQALADYHVRGEWFEACAGLRRLLEERTGEPLTKLRCPKDHGKAGHYICSACRRVLDGHVLYSTSITPDGFWLVRMLRAAADRIERRLQRGEFPQPLGPMCLDPGCWPHHVVSSDERIRPDQAAVAQRGRA